MKSTKRNNNKPTVNDSELILMWKRGNKEAIERLSTKYMALIHNIVITFLKELRDQSYNYYFDELISIATDAFFICVKSYTPGSNSFLSYWWGLTETRFRGYFKALKTISESNYDNDFMDKVKMGLADSAYEPAYFEDSISAEVDIAYIVKNHENLFTSEEKFYLLSSYGVQIAHNW